MKWSSAITLIFLLLPTIAFCETGTFACIFKSYCNETGLHNVENQFKLVFIVDKGNERAYMVGNQGSTEVTLFLSASDGITFVEVTPGGNIMTTTIDSKGASVHSRNTISDGEIVPSQYYGKCIFK